MQTIIVYRNPLEAMFWEHFDIFADIVGAALVFVAFVTMIEHFRCKVQRKGYIQTSNFIYRHNTKLSVVLTCLVGWLMFYIIYR